MRMRPVTFLQVAKRILWLGPSFPGQGENGKTYMTSSEDPLVRLSPRTRERFWGESVSATQHVVDKGSCQHPPLSLILRMQKIYRLGFKAETERWDPLWPHRTSVLGKRLEACLSVTFTKVTKSFTKDIRWSSRSVWSELIPLSPGKRTTWRHHLAVGNLSSRVPNQLDPYRSNAVNAWKMSSKNLGFGDSGHWQKSPNH